MSLVRRVATRFIFDQKNSGDPSGGFVSFIAWISILGLSLGVTALLVVTSVMNGFEKELKSVLTSFHGHVLLFSRQEPISEPEKFMKELRENFPDIQAISPYIFAEAMLSPVSNPAKPKNISLAAVSGAVVEGYDPRTYESVTQTKKKLKKGALPSAPNEIALGSEVAHKLRAEVNDEILLTIPFAKGDAPLVQKLKVSGIVQFGMYDYDSKYSLVLLSDLQRLLGLGEKVNAFKIVTHDLDESLKTASALNERYVYPVRARDWSTLNKNIFYAIRLEKAVIVIILMAIILVASFNIISTLMMLVHDKRRQISMLKALGWGRKETFAIFLWISASLSVCGTLLGLGIGRFLCAILQWTSIIDLPADIYMFSRLPVQMRAWEWVGICVLSVALAIFATLLPSHRMSKESPVEGLRYE